MTGPWSFRIHVLLLIGALVSGFVSALGFPDATVYAEQSARAIGLQTASLADGTVNCYDVPGAPTEIYAPGDLVEVGPTSRRGSRATQSRLVTGFAPNAFDPRPFTGLVEITGSPVQVSGPHIGLGCFWPIRVQSTGETGFVE